jgi:hypothetical protein
MPIIVVGTTPVEGTVPVPGTVDLEFTARSTDATANADVEYKLIQGTGITLSNAGAKSKTFATTNTDVERAIGLSGSTDELQIVIRATITHDGELEDTSSWHFAIRMADKAEVSKMLTAAKKVDARKKSASRKVSAKKSSTKKRRAAAKKSRGK